MPDTVTDWRQEARADVFSLLAWSQRLGSTELARRKVDFRATRAFNFLTRNDSDDTVHYSSPVADKALDWADERLKLPADDPRHFSKLSVEELWQKTRNLVNGHPFTQERFQSLRASLRHAMEGVIDVPEEDRFAAAINRGLLDPNDPDIQRMLQAHDRVLDKYRSPGSERMQCGANGGPAAEEFSLKPMMTPAVKQAFVAPSRLGK